VQDGSLNITAPALGLPGQSETEILGAVTWLWMHSLKHRGLPLIALSQTLLTPLKAQQFMLVSEAGPGGGLRPVAYLGWGKFNAEAEARYLKAGTTALLRTEDWNSGDRMWITDWVTPFGHAPQFRRIVQSLLADSCFRALYHRGGERGQRVKAMRGDRVSRADADVWWRDRPLPIPASII
jgi:cytolysin-activating lysine-acyltransferase